ncbi:MAG: YihY/virulence factor BrkB family protein [Actinomycetota bacterium]|jgi:membrane protein|nr:YihY/virulence factor BrkB family protein [Actinomycetota bacterium]
MTEPTRSDDARRGSGTLRRDGGRWRPSPAGDAAPEISDATRGDWVAALASARRHMKRDRAVVAAGAFAYRWFLSLFPMVIALLAAASVLAIPHHVVVELIKGVSAALPAGAAGVLTGAIHAASSRGGGSWATVIVAGLVALWSATSGMVMVEEGLDMAYEIGTDRSFVQKRLLAIPLLVASALLGGAASTLVVFGAQLGRTLASSVPIAGTAFADGWTVVRWIVALVLVNLLFSFLYWLAPNQRTSWRWASPGAVLGTALWAMVSLGFSFYTTSFGSYGRTYGAFAGVAILIFWLFLTGMAIFVGAEVNAAFERTESRGTFRARSRR